MLKGNNRKIGLLPNNEFDKIMVHEIAHLPSSLVLIVGTMDVYNLNSGVYFNKILAPNQYIFYH